MKWLAAILALMAAVPSARDAAGQERRRANPALEEAPAIHAGATVTIHVAMVEHLAGDGADVRAIRSPEQLDAWMKDLGADRKLLGVTTMEIATVDGREAMTQFGERAAILTGRTRVAREPVNSYDYVEIGTVVRVTPHLHDDGAILVELQLEKSDISPLTPKLPPDEGGEADVIPPNVVRMTVQSMLRLNDGQTYAAYRKATSSPQGMVETVLFLTATAGGPGVPGT